MNWAEVDAWKRERLADEQGFQLKALGLDALDDLWQLAKRQETIEKEGL